MPESPDISSGREGRLEICYQGIWGAVYDPDWSALDAAVTCQQLNFEPKGSLQYKICSSRFLLPPLQILHFNLIQVHIINTYLMCTYRCFALYIGCLSN